MRLLLLIISFLFSFVSASTAQPSGKVYESSGHKFQLEVLLQRSDVIWGFDFLKDGKIIFTERSGQLNIFDPAKKSVVSLKGVPEVYAKGQGGLLDVRVHPQEQDLIYLTYSLPIEKKATTALARARLKDNALADFKNISVAHEPSSNDIHFGSRIVFDGKGHVFYTVGDRNERKLVQNLGYNIGKVMRLKEDGGIPQDNPFVSDKKARPEIWALGVRSPQGLAFHPETSDLWLADMGPRGGDEVNVIQKGLNYGWPVATYGREYYGPKIGKGPEQKGMELPVAYWVPSISPSGMAFYTGDRFPKWKNNIFLANLSGQHLRRLVVDGKKISEQEVLLKDEARFRNVRTGPDGFLYFSTDDGKIARLIPAGT